MILYCWEFGGGLGHLARFLPVARKLSAQRIEVAWAVRDLARVHEVFAPGEFALWQAPTWLHQTHGLPEPAISYAELLLRGGYLNPGYVEGIVRGWRSLIERLSPRVVVADYAPGAMLAARGTGARLATIGHGFFTPPSGSPMPSFFPFAQGIETRLSEAEARVLASANAVLHALGEAPLQRLADLFEVDEQFLTTVAELDHYRVRGGARYWGVLADSLRRDQDASWPPGDGARVLVYLDGLHPWLRVALDVIASMELRALVYAPGLSQLERERRPAARFSFAAAPLDIAAAAAQCDAALLSAGHGSVAMVLRAGRPMVLLPGHAEQAVTARNVFDLGAGITPADGPPDAGRLRAALEAVLRNPLPRRRAEAFAARYASQDPEAVSARIATRLAELAA
ncbi:MAG TPA: nucleotide disphospho-sugar-binding domain-containing protein [Burkholderiales bacterium]|nr:nucleotide disphospho-sugar-binding domain-containing protein [Burkholderiales bacterium]